MKPIIGLVAAAVTVTTAHPWPCFHGDPQHTGRSSAQVGVPLTRAAAYRLGGQVSGSPVVRDNGQVVVGARDVKVYCLDGNLSTVVWVADLSPFGTSIYFSAPALDDSGNCYITTNRKLVKLGPGGVVRWTYPGHNGLSISHSPVIGRDGKVYFACYSDSLYAVNPDSTPAWAAPLGNSVNSAPAVGPDGRVYVATTRGTGGWKLWCFDPDGSSPWSLDLAGDADFASPAVGPDTVIYVGADRYLYAVNPNGTVKWRDSLSARIQSCPAIANESTLYVVAGARLYCVDADSGVRWRRSVGGTNYCSPAVDAQGLVYVGSANSTSSALYVIAPDSTVLDTHPVAGEFWSSPAISGSRVYIGNMNDSMYLFIGPGQGVAGPAAEAAGGLRVAPNPGRGVFLVSGAGRATAISVFSAAGRLVRKAPAARELDLRGLPAGVYLVELRPGRARTRLVLH
ncbi:T9SS type A sorting domain-containing protein [candidate division WOR-3 bacterium]|nr:T9SS type A sorting domain-containing protein [candidate division WOR-3 bacterium]